MSKKQQLIDFVFGNDFIVKPCLRNQFQLMLNDAIRESSSNWISVNERLPEIDTTDEWNKQNKTLFVGQKNGECDLVDIFI